MKAHLFCAALCFAPVASVAATLEADFQTSEATAKGRVTLTQTGSGVLFELSLSGLPPSTWLALHLHENPACDAAGGHDVAGGHFNPGNSEHGWLSPAGPHAGDMPNIWSDATGEVHVQIHNPLLTWGAGPADVQGRALIIHATADDYRSQPSGNAGKRLACAVIPAS